MLRKLVYAVLFLIPLETAVAAVVDQTLDLSLTINYIGANVPTAYADSLAIGGVLNSGITVLNVDDALDGNQSGAIMLVNHYLTILGDSYDLASSPYSVDAVNVAGGVVDGINFASGSIYSPSTLPFITYQTNHYWRIIFPGWNLSDPLSDRYTISGSYGTQLASVPLPAAVWLFGTATFGLLAFRKLKEVV